jgi:hypothetical protein
MCTGCWDEIQANHMAKKCARIEEYGDFQTPPFLASLVCRVLADRGTNPASVLEPTCGIGNFLLAAVKQFPNLSMGLGIDVNDGYVAATRAKLAYDTAAAKVKVFHESFFELDWPATLGDLADPILVVGNPPWVTNSALGALGSANIPDKSNFHNRSGLEAMTGKSNFDLSEWMLIKLLDVLSGTRATLAMLCKTTVARKVLVHAWKNGISLADAEIHPIDAMASFGAAVDACLLVCSLSPASHGRDCRVYRQLGDNHLVARIGFQDEQLVADIATYERWKHLGGAEIYKWRSGVKHDCSKVMELCQAESQLRNGFDEVVELEDDFIFPMLKGSEITNGHSKDPTRWMLVTQRAVGADTSVIGVVAPRTWDYLERHGECLDRRASSIYRNRARFSVFGVGDYTFASWKVCISGFYKKLEFATVGPYQGKPVVLDDTSYFVSCQSEQEAHFIAELLNSQPARAFYSAFVFWDAKRPITIDMLRRLDLSAVARELGLEDAWERIKCEKRMGKEAGRLDIL